MDRAENDIILTLVSLSVGVFLAELTYYFL